MAFVVKDRGQNEQARFESLKYYCLDDETLQYLDEHHADWLLAPCVFDGKLNSSQKTFVHQETRVISHYLSTEQDQI